MVVSPFEKKFSEKIGERKRREPCPGKSGEGFDQSRRRNEAVSQISCSGKRKNDKGEAVRVGLSAQRTCEGFHTGGILDLGGDLKKGKRKALTR